MICCNEKYKIRWGVVKNVGVYFSFVREDDIVGLDRGFRNFCNECGRGLFCFLGLGIVYLVDGYVYSRVRFWVEGWYRSCEYSFRGVSLLCLCIGLVFRIAFF